MNRLVLAALAFVTLASNAEARQRHSHQVSCVETGSIMQPVCMGQPQNPFSGARSIKVTMHRERHAANPGPQLSHEDMAYANPFQSFSSGVAKPSRYVAGRLICAINVGIALAERGIKGTGSAAALSYLHWGQSAGGPVPGAVIVSARRGGGHVAIVSRVENGTVYAWNATDGQSGWREIPYRHHVLDYRMPG